MRAPEVSVVIPIYERQQSGIAALNSALSQRGVDFEVVLVDDGSPTPFRLPADLAADDRVRLVRQVLNAGAAAARNRGIAEARGRWVAFLDSDDLWRPGKLAAQLAYAKERRMSDTALTCVMTGFSQIETATGHRRDRIPMASHDPADFAAGCWFCPGSTALMRREAFDEIGPFDEGLLRLEDLDWFLRLALAGGGVAVLPAVLVDVQVGGRPSVARLDSAVSMLRRKWLAHNAPYRLGGLLRRNFIAYLALEQANVRYHAGRYAGFVLRLSASLLARPRIRIPLRNWWRAVTNGNQ